MFNYTLSQLVSGYYQDVLLISGIILVAMVIMTMANKTPPSNDHYHGHDDDEDQF